MPLLKKFLAERYGSVEAAQSAWRGIRIRTNAGLQVDRQGMG